MQPEEMQTNWPCRTPGRLPSRQLRHHRWLSRRLKTRQRGCCLGVRLRTSYTPGLHLHTLQPGTHSSLNPSRENPARELCTQGRWLLATEQEPMRPQPDYGACGRFDDTEQVVTPIPHLHLLGRGTFPTPLMRALATRLAFGQWIVSICITRRDLSVSRPWARSLVLTKQGAPVNLPAQRIKKLGGVPLERLLQK